MINQSKVYGLQDAQTLKEVNQWRRAMGFEPIDALPEGRCHLEYCPLAQALMADMVKSSPARILFPTKQQAKAIHDAGLGTQIHGSSTVAPGFGSRFQVYLFTYDQMAEV